MKRITIFLVIHLFGLLLSGYAQPTEIQINSMVLVNEGVGISRLSFQSNSLNVTDASGDWLLLQTCRPCRTGTILNPSFDRTVGSSRGALNFSRILTVNGQQVQCGLTLSVINNSPPELIIPYYYPFRRPVTFVRPAQIAGNLRIYPFNNENTTLYTAQINLSGTANFVFTRMYGSKSSGRLVDFRSATYSYSR